MKEQAIAIIEQALNICNKSLTLAQSNEVFLAWNYLKNEIDPKDQPSENKSKK